MDPIAKIQRDGAYSMQYTPAKQVWLGSFALLRWTWTNNLGAKLKSMMISAFCRNWCSFALACYLCLTLLHTYKQTYETHSFIHWIQPPLYIRAGIQQLLCQICHSINTVFRDLGPSFHTYHNHHHHRHHHYHHHHQHHRHDLDHRQELEAKFGDKVEVTGEGTPDTTGYLEVNKMAMLIIMLIIILIIMLIIILIIELSVMLIIMLIIIKIIILIIMLIMILIIKLIIMLITIKIIILIIKLIIELLVMLIIMLISILELVVILTAMLRCQLYCWWHSWFQKKYFEPPVYFKETSKNNWSWRKLEPVSLV